MTSRTYNREAGMPGDQRWPSVPAMARWAAEAFADDEAIVDGPLRLTFAALWAQAVAAARAFVAAGVSPGDRVAIWAPNSAQWVIAQLGIQAAGGVLVPLNTRFKGPEAAYGLRVSGAKLLCTASGFLGYDYPQMLINEDLPALATVVMLDGESPGTLAWAEFLALGDAVHPDVVGARIDALRPTGLCDVLFTSGTTGTPKGAMGTHGANLRAYWDYSTIVGLRRGDRYLVISPFFHSFGYRAGILICLMKGATIVPQPVFDPHETVALISRENITMLAGAPTIFQVLLEEKRSGSAELGSLRLAVLGAAMIPVQLVEQLHSELGFETVLTAYGLTECTALATVGRQGDPPELVATTSGRAVPGVELRVVGDSGVLLPAGTPGEILVRGYNVMPGYFNDPERTAEVVDAGGWLHTGDIGTMDASGNLAITDRLKDMFIVGGFNVYPAEVEKLLATHPDIAQAAVIGVPDARLGEVGKAFVVPVAGAHPDPGALIAWARERLANFKVPRQVVVIDGLPLSAAGKVLKGALRDRPHAS